MKNYIRSITWTFVLLVLLQTALFAGTRPVQITATTSLLACAVKEIGGEHVKVDVIIAPGSCPGHYDVSPKDLRKLSASKLLFTHGFEGFVPKMLSSLGSKKPKQVSISIKGNWMVPSVYIQALQQVTKSLSSADSAHASEYKKNLKTLESRYKKLDTDLRKRLKAAGASKAVVLCSDQQAPLVKWMGLTVVDTYPRAEEFTPVLLHHLTKIGRKKHVSIVIDNLQSGPTAGKELAKDIKAAHITLSNFPGGFTGTDTWSKCLTDNVNRVIKCLKK